MMKSNDFDALITRTTDLDETDPAEIQALEPAALAALTLAQRDLGRRKSDRQIVREMLPNLLCCLEAGYDARDLHDAWVELKVFKGTLATFHHDIVAERKQHPRLSPTVQDRIWTDFHDGDTPSPHRMH